MKTIVLYIFFLFIYNYVKAQPYIDIGGVYGMKGSDVLLSEEGSDIEPFYYGMHVTLPFQLRDSSAIIITAAYEKWQIQFNAGEERFKTALLPVTWLKPLSTEWKISFTAIPRFNNSSGSIKNRDLQFGGAVILTHVLSPKLKLKGGLYYNKEFFGNYFLPLAGIEWLATERLILFGLLPNSLNADYRIDDRLHTGIIYKGITTSFRLDEGEFYDFYGVEEGQISMYADLYITRKIVFNLQAGHTALRNYGYGFSGDNYIKQDLNDGFIYKAGLYYRFWLDK